MSFAYILNSFTFSVLFTFSIYLHFQFCLHFSFAFILVYIHLCFVIYCVFEFHLFTIYLHILDDLDAKRTNIVAVDYDPVDNKIYWTANMETEEAEGKGPVYPDLPGISSIYPNGTGRELIIDKDIDHSDGLAVDYLGNF